MDEKQEDKVICSKCEGKNLCAECEGEIDYWSLRDLYRTQDKYRQLDDIFNHIFGFRLPYIWGSLMPTKPEHEEKIKVAIKAVKEWEKENGCI